MKLQKASQHEIKRIFFGSLILAAIQLAVFAVLRLIKIVKSFYPVLFGTAGGVIITVGCFVILCLAIQRAADTEDKKLMKSRMQLSYNLRLFLQAGWVVASFFIPFVNVIAAAIPLLYPTIIIIVLQRTGKLVTPSERKNSDVPPDDDEEEDRKETFEV